MAIGQKTQYTVKDRVTGETYSFRAHSPLAIVQDLLEDEAGDGFEIRNPTNGGEWELRRGKLVCLHDPSKSHSSATRVPALAAASPELEKEVD